MATEFGLNGRPMNKDTPAELLLWACCLLRRFQPHEYTWCAAVAKVRHGWSSHSLSLVPGKPTMLKLRSSLLTSTMRSPWRLKGLKVAQRRAGRIILAIILSNLGPPCGTMP